MLARIPSIGTPIQGTAIIRALCGRGFVGRFSRSLCDMTGRRHCLLTGSGTAALYIILRALARMSPPGRREVVMPAYTAPSLVLALRAAGTVPVLCDVSLSTFNQALDEMIASIGPRTLAIMPVHMYGLAEDLSGVEQAARRRGAFVIEDAASAMGSSVSGRKAGSMGDVSFFSLNRGKNLSTVAGGAILADSDSLFGAIAEEAQRLCAEERSAGDGEAPQRNGTGRLHLVMKAVGLSLIWRPSLYSLLWPIAHGYRYRGLHDRMSLTSYTEFQAGIGCSLMARRQEIFEKRHENGMYLHRALSGLSHVRLPLLPDNAFQVFNQFPVLVPDAERRLLLGRLSRAGIEATSLYPLPIHRVHDLGQVAGEDRFPGAGELAKGILLLPVHPGVRKKDLARAAGILKVGVTGR